jgi:hypothetical protein
VYASLASSEILTLSASHVIQDAKNALQVPLLAQPASQAVLSQEQAAMHSKDGFGIILTGYSSKITSVT